METKRNNKMNGRVKGLPQNMPVLSGNVERDKAIAVLEKLKKHMEKRKYIVVRINAHTLVQLPPERATPEHIEELKERYK